MVRWLRRPGLSLRALLFGTLPLLTPTRSLRSSSHASLEATWPRPRLSLGSICSSQHVQVSSLPVGVSEASAHG